MASGELARRWAVAAVGVPLGVWVIMAGGVPLAVALGLIAAGSAHEFYGLSRARGAEPLAKLGIPVAGAFAALPLVLSPEFARGELLWLLGMVLLTCSAVGAVFWRGPEGRPLEALSVTVAGALYTGGGLSFAGFLRGAPASEGAALVVFPLLVTWVGDTFAYFGGRYFGKHKLAPKVSPKKTVEGALSGLVGSALSGGIFAALVLSTSEALPIPVGVACVMAVLLGAVGQVGDLAESVLKREAGVKDSGTLLPGHGGLLDRFDAIFFTLPAAYVLMGLWGLT